MKIDAHYYTRATQSIFIVAGILMLFSFPYFFKEFEATALALWFVIVLLAVFAGLAGGGNALTRKVNVVIAVGAFVLSSYRAITLYFSETDEPVVIFSFWILQILSLLFFLAIYFSIRATRK
jgi:hypothetical protein